MRKRWTVILSMLFLIMFMVACGDQITSGNNNSDNDEQANNEVNGNVNEEDEEIENEETGNLQDNNNDNNTENEIEDEEVVEAEYEIDDNWSIVPIDGANEKVVLITIDDAPDKHALDMAKTLEELDVNAIFFVNGHFLETEEEQATLKAIYDKGFLIGNHTYSHPNLGDITEEEQREEIIKVNDMVEEVIGERPKFFRAPHGVNTDFSKNLANEEGMVLMNWTYGYDYFKPYMDKDKITEAMISGEGPEVDVPYSLLKPGANLLMHDREWTAEALHDIITGLRDKGYEMVDPKLIKTIE